MYGEKYEIPLGWVRLEPTPATTAAPSPSESGDITTAPLRLLKSKFFFMEQYYAWFLWMIRRIGYIFGALTHSLYTRNSLDHKNIWLAFPVLSDDPNETSGLISLQYNEKNNNNNNNNLIHMKCQVLFLLKSTKKSVLESHLLQICLAL